MAMSMRERIARVIMEHNLPDDLRDTWENEDQELWLADADAVLSELLTPSDGMALAMEVKSDEMGEELSAMECEMIFTAAIQAAKEGK
jgi:hypothetical protein